MRQEGITTTTLNPYRSPVPTEMDTAESQFINTYACCCIIENAKTIPSSNPSFCHSIIPTICSITPTRVITLACCISQLTYCLGLPPLESISYGCLPLIVVPGWCYDQK